MNFPNSIAFLRVARGLPMGGHMSVHDSYFTIIFPRSVESGAGSLAGRIGPFLQAKRWELAPIGSWLAELQTVHSYGFARLDPQVLL